MLKFFFASIFILTLVFSCKDSITERDIDPSKEKQNMAFNEILEKYSEDQRKLNPLKATSAGDNRYNDQFPNFISDDYLENLKSTYTSYKEQILAIEDSTLSSTQKMSKDVLLWECNIILEKLTFKNQQYFPIDQMWTVNLAVGQLASGSSSQPFQTVQDYENWLKRLYGYVIWLQTAKKNMQKGMAEGYVLPKSLVKKVLPQLAEMTEPDLEKNLFNSPIRNFPQGFTSEEKEELTSKYKKVITGKIIPTYQNLLDFMGGDYLNKSRTTSGIEDTPAGTAYYRHQIKLYTTTDITADEIHQLGLKEVARISSEMEKVKAKLGFKGTLNKFFDTIRSNPQLMPYKEPQQIIENFEYIHNKMQPKLEKLFGEKPNTPFQVKQTEAFRENSASAEYNPGSLDGTRPGTFYVPIPDATKYNVYSDESLFLHEAIPGHHYQISLTQENENLPLFRKTLFYSGYGEGWALYSESLGKELGLYTDPYQYFGMLGAEMHRAVRLVVDTGLHSKGWTREQAIQYSLENEAVSEAGITSEIERYMANPGQALSYKIGQLKIQELRKKAEKELGRHFDIKEFHSEVLETGCIPLQLLENKINAWIKEIKDGPKRRKKFSI